MLVKLEKERASTGEIEVSVQRKADRPVLRILRGALTVLEENTGQKVRGVHLFGDSKDGNTLYIIPSTDPDARSINANTSSIFLGNVVEKLQIEVPAVSLRLPASWDKKNGALKVSLDKVKTVLEAAKRTTKKAEAKTEEASPVEPTETVTDAATQTEKRKRRTKAEMEAARAAEAANPTPRRKRRTKAEMEAARQATAQGLNPFAADGGTENATTEDPFGRAAEEV
jgi:hypothetical protein